MATTEPGYSPEFFDEKNVGALFKSVTDIVSEKMTGEIIFNHSIIDAWYLFKKILEQASRENLPVTIVSGRLRADFYNCLTRQLEALIQAKIPVRAYLAEAAEPDVSTGKGNRNEFAEALLEAQDKSSSSEYALLCAKQPLPSVQHIIYARGKCNDGLCFRMEEDPETHQAIASFGPRKPLIARHLGKVVAERAEQSIKKIKRQHGLSLA